MEHADLSYDELYAKAMATEPVENAVTQEAPVAEATSSDVVSEQPADPTDDAVEIELPPWLGAEEDVKGLTAEQIRALEPVHKNMRKGLNAKFRELAELRKQLEPLAELKKMIDSGNVPRFKNEPTKYEPVASSDDDDLGDILAEVDESQHAIIKKIAKAAEARAERKVSQISERLQRDKIEEALVREQMDFVNKNPEFDASSDRYDAERYQSFKQYIGAKQRAMPGASLEDLYVLYSHANPIAQAPVRKVRVNPAKAVDVQQPRAGGGAKKLTSYELYLEERAKRGFGVE